MPTPPFHSEQVCFIIIVTSISRPSEKIRFYSNNGAQTFWIGDLKTPEFDNLPNLISFTYDDQINHDKLKKIADILPKNHYSRKNIGYLLAYLGKYDYVLDTDDDNYPLLPYDPFPSFSGEFPSLAGKGRVNIYKYFTSSHVWPRGLGYQFKECDCTELSPHFNQVAVWQGLADCDPDVDAIYRLAGLPEVTFQKQKIYTLEKHLYCPFNSQNTLWQKSFLPYSYLPSTVTFRYTDILRGYIAQRCFWEHDSVLGFI